MLLDAVRDLEFVNFRIDHLVDERRRYQLDLDPRFPLLVKLYSFSSFSNALRFNWHERLELFVSVAGRGRFRLGDRVVDFEAGDLIVVDNLKLHGLVDCHGPQRKGVVINFMPELVANAASYPCDSMYLLPFYSRGSGAGPVLRGGDALARPVHEALGRMIECFFDRDAPGPARQAGCKAYLLEALYYLTRHFGLAEAPASEYDGRRRQSLEFGRLYEYLRENFAEPVTVRQAAGMVGMTEFRFMKFFKKATGMTFVSYLTHLRLTNACRLLVESERSIAEVAAAVGFADQSYFDRRFRQFYGQTPTQVRGAAGLSK